MKKTLSEMSLEELWQLFPIVLRPYDPEWPEWYAEEAAAPEFRLDGGKGYTEGGFAERVFHLHIRRTTAAARAEFPGRFAFAIARKSPENRVHSPATPAIQE